MTKRNGQRGFSLVELLVVMAIIAVIAVVAVPSVTRTVAQSRVRSSAVELAGLFQRMRMMAAKDNQFYYGYCPSINSTPSCSSVWIEKNSDTTWDSTEPIVTFSSGVTMTTTGAPTGLSVSGATPTAGAYPAYDSRGMPCTPDLSSSTCPPASSGLAAPTKVYYLTTSSVFGTAKWMAVTIASGGRVQVWTYDSSWRAL